MDERSRSRVTAAQNFDDQQGRVMWATNAGYYNNFLSSLIEASKAILFVNTSLKATLYLVGVVAMSAIFNLFNSQDTVTADRHYLVTEKFIHFGWLITVILLGTYMKLTRSVYNIRRDCVMHAHMLRLLFLMAWCMFGMYLDWLNRQLANCSLEQRTYPNECPAAGYFYGVNSSLDIFMMIHCALAISEDVKSYQTWPQLGEVIYDENFRVIIYDPILRRRCFYPQAKVNAQQDYNSYTPIITVIVVCLAALLLAFEFFLVVSVFYSSHTTEGNIVAAIVAIVGWFINYWIWNWIGRGNDLSDKIQAS